MRQTSFSKVSIAGFQPLPAGSASLKLWLVALPPLVAGMASSGLERAMGLSIGFSWCLLLIVALERPRLAALLLPTLAAAWFVATLLSLPFNSPAFIVDSWAALAMLLMAFPRTVAHAPASAPAHAPAP